ncbi:MFS transporter [Streptomyces iconiensis]|uniref:Multidrug efflux pump Tap n=1 Tax=Streptomyces iconiensis TaxID=1384038 RepID=A0ABT7A5I6_9ACTN|nr:MFS transporter [Streptomyces iconiensis]MDJ1136546.1 MFS transporter [Streptomyces iconiensis]
MTLYVGPRTRALAQRRTRAKSRRGLVTLLVATAVSSLGEAMMIVAIPWFVLETTGSVVRTGVIIAVGTVVSALAGALTGPLVDRWGFRRMAVVSHLVSGTGAACIPLLHALGMLDFATLIAVVAAAYVLDIPAVASVTGLVPGLARGMRMPLERGNALLTGIHQVATLVGPPLGGLLLAVIGAPGVLLLNAGGGLIAAGLLSVVAVVPDRTEEGEAEDGAHGGGQQSYRSELLNGVRTLWRNRLVRTLTLSGTAFNTLDSGLSGVVLVTYAYQHLDSASSLGFLLSAFGLGSLAGTLGYAAVGHRIGRRRTFLTTGFAVAALIVSLAAMPPLLVSAGVLAALGAVAAPVGPLRVSVLQEQTPAGQYGQVKTAVDTVGITAAPLGAMVTVFMVGALGLQPAIFVIGIAYLVVVAACWAAPALRKL